MNYKLCELKMFEQFLRQQNKIRLPISGNLYYVDISGKITDNQGNEIKNFIDHNGDLCVKITWINGFKKYRVADLVAFTFKPVFLPFQEWEKIWVIFKDNNNLNVHPSNLIWKFPPGGIETNIKNFYYIPNFTKYAISKNGDVLNLARCKKLNGSFHEKGYLYFALAPDIKYSKSTVIGRHRLLAMVFLNYSEKVDQLEVNHKDGNPRNDVIDNLEWVTVEENIRHAFLNNLRHDNKKVTVTNHNTGEVTEYYSAHECGRCLGLGKAIVHWRIKNSPGKIFYPGFSFKYTNDNFEKRDPATFRIKVKLTNTKTNEILFFDSIRKCSLFLKVSKKVIQKRLKNNVSATFKEYYFEKIT